MSRILVVEDSELDFEFVRRALAIRGHELIWVDSVDEALHRLRQPEIPDLILTDMGVRPGGGERVLDEVRKNPVIAHLPVVAVTGTSEHNARESLLAVGFNGFFAKPIDPVRFGADVEKFLTMRRGADRESSARNSVLAPTRPPEHAPEEISDASLATRLAAIAEKYRSQLPRKVAHLAKNVNRLRRHPEDLPLLTEIRQQLHSLRGTSHSLGFEKMATAFLAIENAFGEMSRHGRCVATNEWEEISEKLKEVEETPIAAEAPAVANTVLVGTSKILWVDDDPLFLRQVVAFAQAQFVDVVAASTPAEALASAAAHRPDAAVIDLWLPGAANGLELARDLRALRGCEALPLAFVSVDASFGSRIAASNFGAAIYLAKPLDQRSFSEIVQQLLLIVQDDPARVLVVDDDEFFCTMTADILRTQGIHVTTLQQPEKILAMVQDVAPDVILLDIEMPGMNGFDVCRVLRAAPRWRDTAILFVTGSSGPENRTAAFRAGADDFIPKPFDNDELVARVNSRIARQRAAGLRSDRDPLTGILRRHAFLDRMTVRVSEANRHGLPFSLALLDIDDLKTINDTHGHLVGDRALTALGNLLETVFRAHDLRGRWGGDEFAVAFFNESGSAAHLILNQLREKFNKLLFEGGDDGVFQIGLSGGIATLPFDGNTTETLFRVADRRLYRAKREGRNRIV